MTLFYGPTLEVDLAAIARNYGRIKAKLTRGRAGAVVKANAYGLGAVAIAPTLFDAGCRDFFVATLEEAIELRAELDEDEPRLSVSDANIYVFHGVRKGQEKDFVAHRLIPVLNDAGQIEVWNNAGPCVLHFDTGITRLGLPAEDAEKIATKKPGNCILVMSHLACASDPRHPKNNEQLALFNTILKHFPGMQASFANSSGVCLGSDYHFDIARPGRALYGISRGAMEPGNLENVVTLSAPAMQYRIITAQQAAVGYGATATVKKGAVLATVECGYADGFMRTLTAKTYGFAAGVRVPIVGLVSMDMVILDVSAIPEQLRTPDLRFTFIGKDQPIDTVADQAGTIGYEIFTRLGRRVKRIYK